MDIFTRKELVNLLSRPSEIGVSIYLPTNPVSGKEQDPIRFKNLIKEATQKLITAGFRRPKAKNILEPAERILDDPLFWRHRGRGLAAYASPKYFTYYRTPFEMPESVNVGESFQLAPMMPILYNTGRYYILALSENQVRLLECTRESCRNATPEDIPQNENAAVKLDAPEARRQSHPAALGEALHSPSEGNRATTGAGAQVRQGASGLKDYEKSYILEYFQRIDRKLNEILKNEKGPLVLAAVGYLHPIYRTANSYAGLLAEGLTGNFDDLSEQAIHDRAWLLVEPIFNRNMLQALDNYHLAASKGLASTEPTAIMTAISDGRVSTLFIAKGEQLWGNFEPVGRQTTLSEAKAGQDLIGLAVLGAVSKGADVYTTDRDKMPDRSKLAAEFRY